MSNSFSVLFLTSWYPTDEYPTHGIFIRNHAKALSRYCNVIVIYVYSSKELQHTTLEHSVNGQLHEYVIGFSKSKIPFLKSFIYFIKYAYYYYQLSKLVKKHFGTIPFAQINVIFPVSLFFPIIRYVLDIRYFSVFEQWTGYLKEDNSYKGWLRKFVTKKIIQKAEKVWCLCDYQKQSMQGHQLFGNYDVLGNVVNTDIFLPKKNFNPTKKFVHISTLDDKQKNITGIFRVFAELEKEGHHFELIVIGGKDEYLIPAKKLAQVLGLTKVVFKGIIAQENLPLYYQSADAFVMFSNYETFCVVVYEALSCGTYVITSNVADFDKILPQKFATIVSPQNESELKSAILSVLDNKISINPEEAHQWVKENFSEEIIGKKFFEFYSNLYHSIKNKNL
jgi:glycosyltransferase involved in cell wall biosynthesis